MERVATSDHVVVESWLLICSRLGRRAAMRFWGRPGCQRAHRGGVTAEDFRRGHEIAQAWSDQTFSMVDRTSFALIERLGIRRTFAFDRHFRMVRLGWRRQLALEIVPH
jgi:predicted nucleic acid-binding protein